MAKGCSTPRRQLLVLLTSEFCNLELDGLFNAVLQLSTVSKLEEHLEPDEQRCEEYGLEQVVQQSRGSAFVGTMTHELQKPTKDMRRNGDLVCKSRVGGHGSVGTGCAGEAENSQCSPSHGLEKDIESAPDEGGDGAQIQL